MSGLEAKQESTPQQAAAPASVALLDQSLWAQFHQAATADDFVQAWLGLQCRNIPGTLAAVVVLGEPETGPFSPIARWPRGEVSAPDLILATDKCIAQRQGIVVSRAAQSGTETIAHPVLVDGKLYGTVAVMFGAASTTATDALRHLQWGTGWLESLLRREQGSSDAALRDRTTRALNILSVVLEQGRFLDAATALVTELAVKLDCDQVGIGFLRRRRARVVAVSHTSGFGSRMNLIRDMGLAMDEAIDQQDLVLFPPGEGWDYRVTRMHEDLAMAHRAGSVLTVPLQSAGTQIGALTFERPANRPFDDDTVALCDVIASMVAPVLAEKKKNDRMLITKMLEVIGNQITALLGPRYLGRKLASIAAAILLYLGATVTSDYTVSAAARIEGAVQRTVVAPFNGYIQSGMVRAGAEVSEGEVLATLNDQDLVLERLRWSSARSQREIEFDRALAERERAEANIIRSQIAQADAQLALIDEQLTRTRILAPFDGVIVSGDLSQSIGGAVERGEELFKVAPLDAFRVVIEIDESDIAAITQGQTGKLRVAARPSVVLDFVIEHITPVARQADGRNFFRVEAALIAPDDWIRPSMEGIARVVIGERLVVDIWTRRLVDWVRLAVWRLAP